MFIRMTMVRAFEHMSSIVHMCVDLNGIYQPTRELNLYHVVSNQSLVFLCMRTLFKLWLA